MTFKLIEHEGKVYQLDLSKIQWPDLEIFQDKSEMLALQLMCWDIIHLGLEPPDGFTDWLDKASKITGAWTSSECIDLNYKLEYERKIKERLDETLRTFANE